MGAGRAERHTPQLDPGIESAIVALDAAEKMFASLYLQAREQESRPGRPLSVEDAKANAVDLFARRGFELPETLRFRLHALLLIERAVEPD